MKNKTENKQNQIRTRKRLNAQLKMGWGEKRIIKQRTLIIIVERHMILVWFVQIAWAILSLPLVPFRAASPPPLFRLGDRDTWICLCRRSRGAFVKVTWAERRRRDGRVPLVLSDVLKDAVAGVDAPIEDEKSTRIRRWRFFLLASWNVWLKKKVFIKVSRWTYPLFAGCGSWTL